MTLIIFEGSPGSAAPEAFLGRVRKAVALDNACKALLAPGIARVIVCTDSAALVSEAGSLGPRVLVEPGSVGGAFHFGRRLLQLVRKHELSQVFCMGGGTSPLATSSELSRVASFLDSSDTLVLTNNIYSSDLVALKPASILEGLELPESDNSLPSELERAGFKLSSLPWRLGYHFDLDTPVDAVVLGCHPAAGLRTRDELARAEAEGLTERMSAILGGVVKVSQDPVSELLVCGRVGSRLFSYLDRRTRCRLRLVSEERGMKALGRETRGEVVSILAFLLLEAGPERFFDRLSKVSGAAVLDTRVLLAHVGKGFSRSDRFRSDLGLYEEIEDPFLRRFTRAAATCGVPILLGGHSLVTGGLWALLDSVSKESSE
ncbi:MAG: hypothetical protein HYY08_03005 [Firmicutes bacterium]|nr:hypothetical protein [Bacillota bacterium]